jgi:Holliday junction resolvase RusA-like endonuclease
MRHRRSIAASPSLRRAVERVELVLPLPISANALFVTGKNGRRFKTAKYRAWIAESGWRIQQQRVGRIDGAYEAEICVSHDSKLDLDNHCKAIFDVLQRHQIIENDRLAQRIIMSRSRSDDAGARVVLTKWEA